MGIVDSQQRVLDTVAREAGVMAWNFASVPNPTEPRDQWGWRERSCRHAADRHHGGAAATLSVLRKLNKGGQDVYFRPSAGSNPDSIIQYRYFVLDDVPEPQARQIAYMNRALLVRTSTAGGCQVWIFTSELLTAAERLAVQQHYSRKLGADIGATGGTQYSRLPGFKNYKRGGQWVNVLAWPRGPRLSVALLIGEPSISASPVAGNKPAIPVPSPKFSPDPPPEFAPMVSIGELTKKLRREIARQAELQGKSTSEHDFHACRILLRAGCDPDALTDALTLIATRKGKAAGKYAARTVAAADARK
jgi:hypothetical protein